ncbi:unnamed protein product [Echinostoma caproni]|uniref:Plastocyanin-like domain-containing protein n=1 Tax=Echinostoma caproni TaxID=27848 RepID=A0A183A9J8_9TREM|nr:unnamed protein product [Echinostoma caproni]
MIRTTFLLFQCSAVRSENLIVRSTSGVPRYRLISYIVQKTESTDTKVKGLDIPPNEFHMHVHLAWDKATHRMSTVVVDPSERILGANLVLPYDSLADLYAPGNISNVVDFAMNCYSWARPKDVSHESAGSFVSTLRAFNGLEVNQLLIRQTTVQFQMHSKPGSHHFLWEDQSIMHDFLISQNYTRVACGNSEDNPNPCDWRRVGIPAANASTLCLYRTTNPSWKKVST